MPRATWKGVVIAESPDTVVVEGNHYFPRESLDEAYFQTSDTISRCFWKGTASYLHVAVNGETNADAAWFYETPSPAAAKIQGRVAFWKGVQVA